MEPDSTVVDAGAPGGNGDGDGDGHGDEGSLDAGTGSGDSGSDDAGSLPEPPHPLPPDPAPDAGVTDPADPDAGAMDPSACQPTGERCSFVDENCNGENNEGLDCTFVAVSNDTVFRVDPFGGTVTAVTGVERFGAEVLFDVDTGPDGTLWATAGRSLYRVETDGSLTAVVAGTLPFNPNGLAVGPDGSVFVSNHDRLVGSKVVSAPTTTTAPAFFASLDDLHSSGDCVRHKRTLLVSVVGDGSDRLASVDLETHEVSIVGDLSFDGVMGLSSAFGFLFGVTGDGEVLVIDDETASTDLLFDVDVRFTGASSRP
jgi:hypothetical protein